MKRRRKNGTILKSRIKVSEKGREKKITEIKQDKSENETKDEKRTRRKKGMASRSQSEEWREEKKVGEK